MSTDIIAGQLPVYRPWPRRIHLATMLAIAAATPLALPSTPASAADMPVKSPAAHTYNWGGCYIGANGGGAESGSDFTSTVGTGSHLTPADAALVSVGGMGSANGPNFLGGGQAGCNWQSGTWVYGLEGDVDYFHSNPQFINGTSTLSDGVTTFTVTQSLTTNFFATVRPRVGVAADRNLFYLTAGAAFTKASYAQTYVDAHDSPHFK
jgi:outer membrane immunogenic protein